MAFVRYGIGGASVLVGLICLVAAPGDLALEGFSLFVGAGLSIILLSLLYRYGVRGDEERVREEQARAYFEEHGVWPDEDTQRARDTAAQSRPELREREPTRSGVGQ